MQKPLLERIKDGPLLGDGAMGTQLQLAGLESGGCGEAWNLDHPERVVEIQRNYVNAGSQCLITNTFGGSRIMLRRHGHERDTAAINREAVGISRRAFGGNEGYVLGDMGPFGGLMEPLGEVPQAEVRAAFLEQAKALVSAGADAIIIETQSSLEELGLAVKAAKEAGAPCIIGSLSYDLTRDKSLARTMMGISPEGAAEFMGEAGVHVVALNCGSGMDMRWAAQVVGIYRKTVDLPVMAQPNAGLPVLENMKVVYKETPEEMAAGVPGLLGAGASIIGACCGSTPAHIAAIKNALIRARRAALSRHTNQS